MLRPPWRQAPRLPVGHPLPAAWAAWIGPVQEAATAGFALLPPFHGLTALVVARWLFRSWAAEAGAGRPFIHLDPRHLTDRADPRVLEECFEQAARGWLFIDRGWEGLASAPALGERARAGGGLVLLAQEGPALSSPPGAVAALQALDHTHDVELDPTLIGIRAALLALCQRDSVVLLSGPAGSGRHRLARWAHATLDDRPMVELRADRPERPIPGRWTLVEEPGEGDPALTLPLVRRLDELDAAQRPAGPWEPEAPPRPNHPALSGIIGESPALRRVLHTAARVAPRSNAILVQGERGSGKEDLARAIHALSGRPGRLVTLDLSTCPDTLVDALLFGQERSAFTGAPARKGAFREADRGTLFIDEFGNIDTATQKKLLRAIQFGDIQPLGADRPTRVDVTVVAATNADLEQAARRGEVREDLLDRFARPDRLALPPLRERRGDVRLLADHFAATARGRPPPHFDEESYALLEEWHWPGNIRELRGLVLAAVDLAAQDPAGDGVVRPEHLHHLSPEARRETPLLVLSSEPVDGWASEAGLRRRHRALLDSRTLVVPPWAERAPAALQSQVLAGLQGRPIRTAALRRLLEGLRGAPLPGVHQSLLALGHGRPGPIGVPEVEAQLQHHQPSDRRTLRFVLHPQIDDSGDVQGFIRDFDSSVVVVGRSVGWAKLDGPHRAAPAPREAARKAEIERIAAGDTLSTLGLSHTAGLSREHFVIQREAGGLLLHSLPGVALPVVAGRIGAGGLQAVSPGSPARLGAGGEVRVLGHSGEPLLHLYVFDGLVAWQDGVLAVGDRMRGEGQDADTALPSPALSAQPRSPSPAVSATEAPSNVVIEPTRRGGPPWKLSPAEEDALLELVTDVVESGAPLAPRIREYAERWSTDPARARLSGFLLRTLNWTQQFSRIASLEANQRLRDRLSQALADTPDPEAARALLPQRVREMLGD